MKRKDYAVECEYVFKRNFTDRLIDAYQVFSDKLFVGIPKEVSNGDSETTIGSNRVLQIPPDFFGRVQFVAHVGGGGSTARTDGRTIGR